MIEKISPVKQPGNVYIYTVKSSGDMNFNKFDVESFSSYSALKSGLHPKQLITMHQTHSAKVIAVDNCHLNGINSFTADGLFTCSKTVALGILTADCYPVVIAGKKAVAAVHCGWKGTALGIIENAVRLFQDYGDKPLYAYIGPGISARVYEVRSDFISNVSEFFDPVEYTSLKDGRLYFDLNMLISAKLKKTGINEIEDSGICTFSDESFYSHRRQGAFSGRILTVAGIY